MDNIQDNLLATFWQELNTIFAAPAGQPNWGRVLQAAQAVLTHNTLAIFGIQHAAWRLQVGAVWLQPFLEHCVAAHALLPPNRRTPPEFCGILQEQLNLWSHARLRRDRLQVPQEWNGHDPRGLPAFYNQPQGQNQPRTTPAATIPDEALFRYLHDDFRQSMGPFLRAPVHGGQNPDLTFSAWARTLWVNMQLHANDSRQGWIPPRARARIIRDLTNNVARGSPVHKEWVRNLLLADMWGYMLGNCHLSEHVRQRERDGNIQNGSMGADAYVKLTTAARGPAITALQEEDEELQTVYLLKSTLAWPLYRLVRYLNGGSAASRRARGDFVLRLPPTHHFSHDDLAVQLHAFEASLQRMVFLRCNCDGMGHSHRAKPKTKEKKTLEALYKHHTTAAMGSLPPGLFNIVYEAAGGARGTGNIHRLAEVGTGDYQFTNPCPGLVERQLRTGQGYSVHTKKLYNQWVGAYQQWLDTRTLREAKYTDHIPTSTQGVGGTNNSKYVYWKWQSVSRLTPLLRFHFEKIWHPEQLRNNTDPATRQRLQELDAIVKDTLRVHCTVCAGWGHEWKKCPTTARLLKDCGGFRAGDAQNPAVAVLPGVLVLQQLVKVLMELELPTKEDRLFWETREGQWRLQQVGRTAQEAMQHSQVFANQNDEADYIDDAVDNLQSLFRTAECYAEWVGDQQAQPGANVDPRAQIWDWPQVQGAGGGGQPGNAPPANPGPGPGLGGGNMAVGGQNQAQAEAAPNNGQPQQQPGFQNMLAPQQFFGIPPRHQRGGVSSRSSIPSVSGKTMGGSEAPDLFAPGSLPKANRSDYTDLIAPPQDWELRSFCTLRSHSLPARIKKRRKISPSSQGSNERRLLSKAAKAVQEDLLEQRPQEVVKVCMQQQANATEGGDASMDGSAGLKGNQPSPQRQQEQGVNNPAEDEDAIMAPSTPQQPAVTGQNLKGADVNEIFALHTTPNVQKPPAGAVQTSGGQANPIVVLRTPRRAIPNSVTNQYRPTLKGHVANRVLSRDQSRVQARRPTPQELKYVSCRHVNCTPPCYHRPAGNTGGPSPVRPISPVPATPSPLLPAPPGDLERPQFCQLPPDEWEEHREEQKTLWVHLLQWGQPSQGQPSALESYMADLLAQEQKGPAAEFELNPYCMPIQWDKDGRELPGTGRGYIPLSAVRSRGPLASNHHFVDRHTALWDFTICPYKEGVDNMVARTDIFLTPGSPGFHPGWLPPKQPREGLEAGFDTLNPKVHSRVTLEAPYGPWARYFNAWSAQSQNEWWLRWLLPNSGGELYLDQSQQRADQSMAGMLGPFVDSFAEVSRAYQPPQTGQPGTASVHQVMAFFAFTPCFERFSLKTFNEELEGLACLPAIYPDLPENPNEAVRPLSLSWDAFLTATREEHLSWLFRYAKFVRKGLVARGFMRTDPSLTALAQMVAVTANVLGWIDRRTAAELWEEDEDSLVSLQVLDVENPPAGHPKLREGDGGWQQLVTFLWLSCKTRGAGPVQHYELCWDGEEGLEKLAAYERSLSETGTEAGSFLGFSRLADKYWGSDRAQKDFHTFLTDYVKPPRAVVYAASWFVLPGAEDEVGTYLWRCCFVKEGPVVLAGIATVMVECYPGSLEQRGQFAADPRGQTRTPYAKNARLLLEYLEAKPNQGRATGFNEVPEAGVDAYGTFVWSQNTFEGAVTREQFLSVVHSQSSFGLALQEDVMRALPSLHEGEVPPTSGFHLVIPRLAWLWAEFSRQYCQRFAIGVDSTRSQGLSTDTQLGAVLQAAHRHENPDTQLYEQRQAEAGIEEELLLHNPPIRTGPPQKKVRLSKADRERAQMARQSQAHDDLSQMRREIYPATPDASDQSSEGQLRPKRQPQPTDAALLEQYKRTAPAHEHLGYKTEEAMVENLANDQNQRRRYVQHGNHLTASQTAMALGLNCWREKQAALARGHLKKKAAEKREEKTAQSLLQLNLDGDSMQTPVKDLHDSSADQTSSGGNHKRAYQKMGGPFKNYQSQPDEAFRESSGDQEPQPKQQKVAGGVQTQNSSQSGRDYMGQDPARTRGADDLIHLQVELNCEAWLGTDQGASALHVEQASSQSVFQRTGPVADSVFHYITRDCRTDFEQVCQEWDQATRDPLNYRMTKNFRPSLLDVLKPHKVSRSVSQATLTPTQDGVVTEGLAERILSHADFQNAWCPEACQSGQTVNGRDGPGLYGFVITPGEGMAGATPRQQAVLLKQWFAGQHAVSGMWFKFGWSKNIFRRCTWLCRKYYDLGFAAHPIWLWQQPTGCKEAETLLHQLFRNLGVANLLNVDAEVDVDSYWSPVLPRPDRNEMGLSETYCLTRDQLRNTLALFVKVWMSPNVSQNPKATTAMLGPASVVLGKMFSEEWLDPDVEVPTNLKSALGVQAVLFQATHKPRPTATLSTTLGLLWTWEVHKGSHPVEVDDPLEDYQEREDQSMANDEEEQKRGDGGGEVNQAGSGTHPFAHQQFGQHHSPMVLKIQNPRPAADADYQGHFSGGSSQPGYTGAYMHQNFSRQHVPQLGPMQPTPGFLQGPGGGVFGNLYGHHQAAQGAPKDLPTVKKLPPKFQPLQDPNKPPRKDSSKDQDAP